MGDQLQLPIFLNLQVLTNVCPGDRPVPSGMVMSARNSELLQLEAAAPESCVAVGVGVGVEVAVEVAVGWAVSVPATSVATCPGTVSVDCAEAAEATILPQALNRTVRITPIAIRPV